MGSSGIEPIIEDRTAQMSETRIDATQGRVVEQANNSSGSSVSSFKKEMSEIEGSFNLDRASSKDEHGTASTFFGIENASSIHTEELKGAGYFIPEDVKKGDDGDIKSSSFWLFEIAHKDEVLS